MKLSARLLTIYSVLMVCAVAGITAYTTTEQRRSQIERELTRQSQLRSLMNKAVEGQYYSNLNLSVTYLSEIRAELEDRSEFLKGYFASVMRGRDAADPATREAVMREFERLKSGYNTADFDLLVSCDGRVLLPPALSGITDGESIGGKRIMNMHSAQTQTSLAGYYLTLYSKSGSDAMLTYTFSLQLDRLYRLTLVKRIDRLLASHEDSRRRILEQLKDTVYSISDPDMTSATLIVDGATGEILLSAASDSLKERYPFLRNAFIPKSLLESLRDADRRAAQRLSDSLDEQARRQLTYDYEKDFQAYLESYNVYSPEHTTYQQHDKAQDLDYYGRAFSRTDRLRFDMNGLELFITYDNFRALNWFTLELSDHELITAPAVRQAKAAVLIGMGVLLMTLLSSLFLSRRITKGLHALSRKASRISRADLSDPEAIAESLAADTAVDRSADEVRNLDRALNVMGRSLQENIRRLMTDARRRERMESELDTARQIQMGLLAQSGELPQGDGFAVSARMCPAKEVGGDLYDAFMTEDGRLSFVLGDVSDKGVPAALFMSMTLNLTRAFLRMRLDPAECCRRLNNSLSERNPNMMFVTLCVGVADLKSRKILLCNAGHCPPYLMRDGRVRALDLVSGPAVGVMDDAEYSEYEVELCDGDTLFLYTDGVTEAQDEEGNFFGDARLRDLLEEKSAVAVGKGDLCAAVFGSVESFRKDAQQSDDITVMALEFLRRGGDGEDVKTEEAEADVS